MYIYTIDVYMNWQEEKVNTPTGVDIFPAYTNYKTCMERLDTYLSNRCKVTNEQLEKIFPKMSKDWWEMKSYYKYIHRGEYTRSELEQMKYMPKVNYFAVADIYVYSDIYKQMICDRYIISRYKVE